MARRRSLSLTLLLSHLSTTALGSLLDIYANPELVVRLPTTCPAGSYLRDSRCLECPEGFQCPSGLLARCPAGSSAPAGSSECWECITGAICGVLPGTPGYLTVPEGYVEHFEDDVRCGEEEMKCARPSGWGGNECVDPMTSLESCGGCTVPDRSGFASGVDCTAIEGVSDVSCSSGRCVIGTCKRGYRMHRTPTGLECVRMRREGVDAGLVIQANLHNNAL